jgi:AraC-like DNA-binding protein
LRYEQFAPSPALSPVVERLWLLEGEAHEIAAEPIPPDGHAEIIVHAGEPFVEIHEGVRRLQDRVLFAGQITRAVQVAPSGYSRMAGARLRPYGAFALFGGPQQRYTDRIVPLAEIDSTLARRLARAVAGLGLTGDLVPALDAALAPAAAKATREVVVAPAVSLAIEQRGLVRVDDLAAHVRLGARQFERRFQEQVGLSPKLFLRILRFQEVLNAIRYGLDATSWADVAAAHGFYDQAHFIHDFKGFVGESPAAWNVGEASLAAIFSAIRRGRASSRADAEQAAPVRTRSGTRPTARTESAAPRSPRPRGSRESPRPPARRSRGRARS